MVVVCVVPDPSDEVFMPVEVEVVPPRGSTLSLCFVPGELPVFAPTTRRAGIVAPVGSATSAVSAFEGTGIAPATDTSVLMTATEVGVSFVSVSTFAYSSSFSSLVVPTPVGAEEAGTAR